MTYSIVARDAHSGELGVAVQSHWFSVGPIVPWARPGVGAVATQANVEVSYGPRALTLLASGSGAAEALERLTAEDSAAATRQVAVVDAAGRDAALHGHECMAAAGTSAATGSSCQANIMAQRHGLGRDARGIRVTQRRRAAASACCARSTPPRRPAVTCAGASRPRS